MGIGKACMANFCSGDNNISWGCVSKESPFLGQFFFKSFNLLSIKRFRCDYRCYVEIPSIILIISLYSRELVTIDSGDDILLSSLVGLLRRNCPHTAGNVRYSWILRLEQIFGRLLTLQILTTYKLSQVYFSTT